MYMLTVSSSLAQGFTCSQDTCDSARCSLLADYQIQLVSLKYTQDLSEAQQQ